MFDKKKMKLLTNCKSKSLAAPVPIFSYTKQCFANVGVNFLQILSWVETNMVLYKYI